LDIYDTIPRLKADHVRMALNILRDHCYKGRYSDQIRVKLESFGLNKKSVNGMMTAIEKNLVGARNKEMHEPSTDIEGGMLAVVVHINIHLIKELRNQFLPVITKLKDSKTLVFARAGAGAGTQARARAGDSISKLDPKAAEWKPI
jgi:hypothetical protein